MNDKWFYDNSKVLQLANWLDDQDDFDTPSHVIEFFEKPWKWDDEYNQMLQSIEHEKNG